ncbi:trimethylamine methyltransferase family protein [Halarchaeum nitratireducens]|uniref:Uncharacterized protein n=1 Tax=Halarchaeum nitratireducens TaxID=489913 RepID=A0A830GC25_9EURY|nr:trimethylamine methyltransferase family protein [Halarchaeum nitratireducens]GGN20556.1 hypothetical protein GCM10009021_22080 [Halarchaeum nitratireducens]
MAAIATGVPSLSRPVIAGLVNTLPPRGIGTEMLGALLAYAEHGQPVIVSSFTMPGASGPRSFAASLAQANAETLFGITLAQLCNPGTPVVYGLPLARVDDRHESLSIGGPASGLFASVTAQLGRYYGVPTRAGGGVTDAVTVGHQSGAESALAQAVTALAGVDFVLHAAGVLDSYAAVSWEKFVLDCETLRALEWFREGISVPEEGIDVERIASVDPAGHYLGAAGSDDDTGFRPRIAERRPHRAWADGTSDSTFERAHEYVEDRLAAYERPPMDDAVERRLRSYVEANLP